MKVFSIKLGRSTIMILALLLSFVLLSPSESASAACDKSWTGTGGTSDWNTATNWGPSGVPGSSDDVCIFPNSSNPDPIINSVIAGSINSLSVSGGETLKINSGSLTVTGNVDINGTIDNKGTLNVGGNFTNDGTYTAQASGTVVMNGSAAQTIAGSATTSFNDLQINNAAGVTLGANADVIGTLTLTNGTLTLGANMLTMGTSATVAGGSASSMIDASGSGPVRKEFGANEPFLYPIGTPGEYSPINVNVTAGVGGSNEYVEVNVTNSAEEHVNQTGTSYINRHWVLSDGGSGLSGDLTMTYLPTDVVGTGTLVAGFYDSATGQWVVGTLLAPEADVSINGLTGLNGNSTSGTAAALAVQLASFSAIFTGEHVLVEWGTVFETNNLGFNLYRSTSANELGTKINGNMIASQAPGSGQGSLYGHQDSNIESGMTYFYTLEDIDVNGVTGRHGPVSVETSNIATAVTLEEIGTSSPSQSGALYLLLGSVLLAGAGFTLYRRRSA